MCKDHSKHKLPLPEFNLDKPQRLCDDCFDVALALTGESFSMSRRRESSMTEESSSMSSRRFFSIPILRRSRGAVEDVDPDIGRRVPIADEVYVVEKKLAQGAVGTVYLAKSESTYRPFALKKIIRPRDNPELANSIAREINIVSFNKNM